MPEIYYSYEHRIKIVKIGFNSSLDDIISHTMFVN